MNKFEVVEMDMEEEVVEVEEIEEEVTEEENVEETPQTDVKAKVEAEFKRFVNEDVLDFLEEFGLKKIQVVDENGNKGTITRYKEMLKCETTIKDVI